MPSTRFKIGDHVEFRDEWGEMPQWNGVRGYVVPNNDETPQDIGWGERITVRVEEAETIANLRIGSDIEAYSEKFFLVKKKERKLFGIHKK